MPGLGLVIKALRHGLLAPAERSGRFPTRHYVAMALDALEAGDFENAVRALETGAMRGSGSRLALAREQAVFRLRLAAGRRLAAAERAGIRAGWLATQADEVRRRAAVRRALPLAGGLLTLLAIAGAWLLDASLQVLAVAALVGAAATFGIARLRGPATPDEPTRLEAAATAERALAVAERRAAADLNALEARLLPYPSRSSSA